jgi:hypothetical protein
MLMYISLGNLGIFLPRYWGSDGDILNCGRVLRRTGKRTAFASPRRRIFDAKVLAGVGSTFRSVRLSTLTDPNIRRSPGLGRRAKSTLADRIKSIAMS